MSADNEIGVCRFNDGWRIAMLSASDWCPADNQATLNAFDSLRFKDSELFATEEAACDAACAWEDRIDEAGGYVEYGVYTLDGERTFLPEEEAKPIVEAAYRAAEQRQKNGDCRFP